MCGDSPPARLSHGKYVSTESANPLKFVKNELKNSSQTTNAAAVARPTCFKGTSPTQFRHERSFGFNAHVVPIPATVIAKTLSTNVSLVANISPIPVPLRIAQSFPLVCVYRQPAPIASA